MIHIVDFRHDIKLMATTHETRTIHFVPIDIQAGVYMFFPWLQGDIEIPYIYVSGTLPSVLQE